MSSVEIVYHPNSDGRMFVVHVPTERGGICVVNVLYSFDRLTYQVEFSAQLLDQCPEALLATLHQTFLAIQEETQ